MARQLILLGALRALASSDAYLKFPLTVPLWHRMSMVSAGLVLARWLPPCLRFEDWEWIDRRPVDPDLEVEVRAG